MSQTPNPVLERVLADLAAEGDQLDRHVTALTPEQWRTPTPAPGWDIATQVAHLAWTDEAALAAARTIHGDAGDKDTGDWDQLVLAAIDDPNEVVDKAAVAGAQAAPEALLARWRTGRTALAEALRAVPAGTKLPWFGPPMSPTSMATARFMETWAHALDTYDALGSDVAATDRIEHVVHLGVRTRNFSFATNGLTPPDQEFRIVLAAPSGASWTHGPEDARQSVTGSALDFCRLVTQRVHRDDTDLVALGADADRWLDIAQAFAGNPGAGREKK